MNNDPAQLPSQRDPRPGSRDPHNPNHLSWLPSEKCRSHNSCSQFGAGGRSRIGRDKEVLELPDPTNTVGLLRSGEISRQICWGRYLRFMQSSGLGWRDRRRMGREFHRRGARLSPPMLLQRRTLQYRSIATASRQDSDDLPVMRRARWGCCSGYRIASVVQRCREI